MKFKVFKKVFYFALGILFVGIQFVFGACANAAGTSKKQLKMKFIKTTQNEVHIAMALDDNYVYQTIVSMVSALENKSKNSKYEYHIMHPSKFKESNKNKIKQLEAKYSGCKINFINMGTKFSNAKQGSVTTPAYYRLALSELLPRTDRIIWIDGDTLVLHDLSEMYNLNMKGLYYRGFLDHKSHIYATEKLFDKSEKSLQNYICSGVLLINSKKLRQDNMVEKYNEFIEKNNDKLAKHDQTVINVMCAEEIKPLPAKYGIFNFSSEKNAINYPKNRLISSEKYSAEEMKQAYQDPTILHMVNKPWRRSEKVFGGEKWWQYAYKSSYFEEIATKYLFNNPEKIKYLPKDLQEVIKTYNWPSEKTASSKKSVKKRSAKNNKSKPKAKRSKTSKK